MFFYSQQVVITQSASGHVMPPRALKHPGRFYMCVMASSALAFLIAVLGIFKMAVHFFHY